MNLTCALSIFLFLVITVLVVFYFYHFNMKPALFCLLICYIPLQNLLLPYLLTSNFMPHKIGMIFMAYKDMVIFLGIILSVTRYSIETLQFFDFIGIIFILYLIANLISSNADFYSSIMGFRSYSIPILVYFYGRFNNLSDFELYKLCKLIFFVAFVVSLFCLAEYCYIYLYNKPILLLMADYFDQFYGHGSPNISFRAKGFLNFIKINGPFGNNLILSTYLRVVFCLWIFSTIYFRKKIDIRSYLFIFFIVLCSVLTFSRYGIFSITLILIFSLFINRLNKFTKIAIFFLLIFSAFLGRNTILNIYTKTINVEDESTHAHIESVQNIGFNLFGNGLGTGAHSKIARSLEKASEGEGYIKQSMPEIGVLGITIFFIFVLLIFFRLNNFKINLSIINTFSFWISLALFFEFLRTPIDISIRSFLGTSTLWFFCGAIITNLSLKEQSVNEKNIFEY